MALCAAFSPGQSRPPPSKPRLHERPRLSQAIKIPLNPKGRAYRRGPRGRERGKAGIQESRAGWSSALLKAVTDQVLRGCRFWPMYIFSHSFCNNKGGESQEKKLGVSMKKRGLIFQDLFVLHTKQTGSPPPGCNISQ